MFSALRKKKLAARLKEAGGQSVLEHSAFAEALARELQRTSRSNSVFSLVKFLADDQEEAELVRLIELLADQRRSTDTLGWVEPTTPACLLAETDQKGAEIYVRRILERFGETVKSEIETMGEAGSSEVSIRRSESQKNSDRPGPPSQGLVSVAVKAVPLWKTALDRTAALFALILLAPLFLAVALVIKLGSPGPVLFQQTRLGLGGREFTMWKFRTMRRESSERHEEHVKELIRGGAQLQKMDGELPLAPFGRVLRSTSIDELPQLFNVLRGNMSLVGPRPCMPYEAQEFEAWHFERFLSQPGITGLWQVSGKNETTFVEMMRLDIRYGRQVTPRKDTSILYRTVPVVLEGVTSAARNRWPSGARQRASV